VCDNDNLIIIKPLLLIQNVFALEKHGVRSGIRAHALIQGPKPVRAVGPKPDKCGLSTFLPNEQKK
jgi:hypothetical protein